MTANEEKTVLDLDDNYSIFLTENWVPDNLVPFMVEGPDGSITFCRKPFRQDEKDLKLRVLARAFDSLFSGNPEAHYVRVDGGYTKVDGGLTLTWVERGQRHIGDIERHLSGVEPGVLSVPILPSGSCHFGAIDADRHLDTDTAIDHVAVARKVTEMALPLIVCRSKGHKSAHLWLFLKDAAGYSAAKVQLLLKHFQDTLGIVGEVEIFPKQTMLKIDADGKKQIGNGINLPFHGAERVALGKQGEVLALEEFIRLAQERRAFGDILMRDYLPEVNSLTDGPQPGASERRPLPRTAVRKIYRKAIREFKKAKEGNRNKMLNNTALVVASAFAAGVIEDKSEEDLKKVLTKIALEIGMKTSETSATLESGWKKGKSDPFTVCDELTSTDGIVYEPGRLAECVAASERVLNDIGKKYYERNLELVSPAYGREIEEEDKIERDENSLLIQVVSDATIARDLDTHIAFLIPVSGEDGEKEYKRIFPPSSLAVHIKDKVKSDTRNTPYPPLDMVVNTPCLLASGEVHDAVGEYRDGILFISSGIIFPRVKTHPTRKDALDALEQFKPLFEAFPFTKKEKEPWHQTPGYSTVLAATLTLVARPAIRASVPLFGFTAPRQRSGKTKLVETICTAALGYKATACDFVDEEEFAKHLLPLLQHQDRAVLIDNIERQLRGSKLAIAITSNSFNDRLLGKSDTIRLTNRAVFFATGNNLAISGDLSYRSLMVTIDPNIERPEERHFDFEPTQRAKERHPELVAAALTALRAFVVAGRPWTLKRSRLGGFAEWDQLVCGTLAWLGYADPAVTRDDVIGSDPEREAHANLLKCWLEEFGCNITTLAAIEKQSYGDTHKALLTKDGWNSYTVRWRLSRVLGRVEDGMKLVRTGEGRTGGYQIVVVDTMKDAPEVMPDDRAKESGEGESEVNEEIPF